MRDTRLRRKHIIALFVGLVVVGFTAYLIFGLNLPENLHPDNLRPGITIDKIDWNDETGLIKAYIRNFGYSTAFSEVYVNGELDDQVMIALLQIARNQTAEITLSKTYAIMPKQITIEVHTTNSSSISRMETFIEFEMLRLYWNESTQRIVVLVTDTGSYPKVDFDKIYVNRILDDAAVIKLESNDDRGYGIYKISLSGIYRANQTTYC